MTITEHRTPTVPQVVTLDLYRDIHKGIRAELFELTLAAGRVDPADRAGREAVALRVQGMVDLLESHAEHEDTAIQPVLEDQLPILAAQIALDHATIDAQMAELVLLARTAAEASGAERRPVAHRLYLELASFTADYLRHQDVEERVVMPALEGAIGVDEVAAINAAIVGSIPPEEMARALGLMLPSMNVDDRAELLGGMQASAPAEVFAGVWGLAGTMLSAPDHHALAARLGIA